MSIDLTKPVHTRDGRKVRILCTDRRGGNDPIVGLVTYSDGTEGTASWRSTGKYGDVESELDLLNVPPPKRKAKVFVELRLDRECRDLYGVAAINRPAHKTENIVLASTVVELEYEEPQP